MTFAWLAEEAADGGTSALEWMTALGTVGAVVLALAIALWEHFRQVRRDERDRRERARADLDETRRLLRAAFRILDARIESRRVRMITGDALRDTDPLLVATVVNALLHHSKVINATEADLLETALLGTSLPHPPAAQHLLQELPRRIDEAYNRLGG